jgi:AcrR family transcriptional regulator
VSGTGARGPIWARPEPGSRRPRFTRDQIAAVAVRVADAEGLAAVSMRRLAAELDTGAMSLYHYVRSKEELIALMDDALMDEVVIPDAELPEEWREALAAVARRTRAVYLRHPWAIQALQGEGVARGTPMGPNAMRHVEQTLAALASAPLDTAGRLELMAVVDDYVFGHVLREAELVSRRELTPEEVEALTAYGMAQLETGRYPRLAALASDPAAALLADPARMDDRFDRGLRALLDGYPAQVAG